VSKRIVSGEKKKHMMIFLSSLLILLLVFSGCVNLPSAYVTNVAISDGWYENTALRNTGSQFLGLEKWSSLTYEINGKYPATLTITSIKTILLSDEQDLKEKTRETIELTFQETLQLTQISSGKRTLLKNHDTKYIIYDGFDEIKNEKVKIIGEVWNCGNSGVSILCIGIAQITTSENSLIENTENWEKIVMDPGGSIEGLTGDLGIIYNVVCH